MVPADDPASVFRVHEIQTALAVISGHAQLLQRRARRGAPLDPAAVLGQAVTIDHLARRLADLLAIPDGAWAAGNVPRPRPPS